MAEQKCELLGFFGIIVQIILGLGAFAVLILKRHFEKPKRQWKIWALDSFKQAISQAFSHILNLYFSYLLSQSRQDDACNWQTSTFILCRYFITILIDTTLGVFLSYVILVIIEKNYKTGNYIVVISPENQMLDDKIRKERTNQENGGERALLRPMISIDMLMWLWQLLIWLLVVLIAKLFLYLIQLQASVALGSLAYVLFEGLLEHPNWKLVIIMIVIPLCLNSFQFWIQDNFLKKKEFTQLEKQYAMSEMYEVEQELQQMNVQDVSPYSNSNTNDNQSLEL